MLCVLQKSKTLRRFRMILRRNNINRWKNFPCSRIVLCAIRFEFLNTVELAVNGTWLEGHPVLSGKSVQFRGSFNSPSGICIKQKVPATEKKSHPLPFRYRQALPYHLQQCRTTFFFFHKGHLKISRPLAGSKSNFNSKRLNFSEKIYFILSD